MVILFLITESKSRLSVTDSAPATAIDVYLRAYVQGNNFSGSVLVDCRSEFVSA
jgi:hypothetical protein